MATSGPPTALTPDTCLCPKWFLLPAYTCPCDEDISEVKTRDDTIRKSAPVDLSKKPIIWVLGGPGSGKGVQCEKIIDKYGLTHLSTGALLRAEVSGRSKRAKHITEIMSHGGLVPDQIALDLLKEAIQAKATNTKGFLVDGFPREKSQAIAFEKKIASPSAILYFEASDETLTQRLLNRGVTSGRPDDNEIAIKQRLKTHSVNSMDLLHQYPSKTSRIDAETSVDAIFAEVQKVLDPIVNT